MIHEQAKKMKLASFHQSFQHPEPPDLSHSFFCFTLRGFAGQRFAPLGSCHGGFCGHPQMCSIFLARNSRDKGPKPSQSYVEEWGLQFLLVRVPSSAHSSSFRVRETQCWIIFIRILGCLKIKDPQRRLLSWCLKSKTCINFFLFFPSFWDKPDVFVQWIIFVKAPPPSRLSMIQLIQIPSDQTHSPTASKKLFLPKKGAVCFS